MPARFSAAPDAVGFDSGAFPPTLVVPLGGEAEVRLENGGNLPLSLQQGKPPNVEISEPPNLKASARRTITIKGKAEGLALLVAGSATSLRSGTAPLLEITVLSKQEVSVQFYALKDRAGRSAGTSAALGSIVDATNAILSPQANITIARPSGLALEKAVPGDLGNPIPLQSPKDDEFADTLHKVRGPAKAKFHVFFVWSFDDDLGAEGRTNGPKQLCWIRHESTSAAATIGLYLAHEVGHLLISKITGVDLGLESEVGLRKTLGVDARQHSSKSDHLMYENSGGTVIPAIIARGMNRVAARLGAV